MKKIIKILIVLLFLTGCTTKTKETDNDTIEINNTNQEKENDVKDLTELEVKIEQEYGGFYIRWNDLEDNNIIYLVLIVKADSKEVLYQINQYYNVIEGWNLVGFAAQENNYYGEAYFLVEARNQENNEVLLSGKSETININEYYPEEKEITIDDLTIRSFSYSAQTSSMNADKPENTILSCYIRESDGKIYITGSYSKGRKEKEVDKKVSQKDWDEFVAFLKTGKLVRKYVRDPDMVVLDEDFPETISIRFADMTDIQERWYEYEPSDKELLMQWLEKLIKQ